ncbi:ABC transporter ATP-binding protein [Lacticaseibacillus paracasei]|nr:ABC transporter ATP-binding protein [Lacticaseibacillus paracasei]
MVNTILKEADLFCPNSVRINFTIYHILSSFDDFLEIIAAFVKRKPLD